MATPAFQKQSVHPAYDHHKDKTHFKKHSTALLPPFSATPLTLVDLIS